MTVRGLHVITDDAGIAAAAVTGGARVIQVRAKRITDQALYRLAGDIVRICLDHGATCIVNDRVDIALAAGAHGTHLGADDLPVAIARSLAGPEHLIGATAREPRRAVELVAAGADYLGVGPAFATTTKQGLSAALGPAGIAAVSRTVPVPVIAIGGVTAGRIGGLLAAGAAGVAVVGAVADAADPHHAVRLLLDALAGTKR
jgi:thiamine-phosphate pyrophosphorylase